MGFNKKFYTYLYQDVRQSKLSPKTHYSDYGVDENRIYNIRSFKNSTIKGNLFVYIEVLFIYLYLYSRKMPIPRITEFIKRCIIFLEHKKFKKYEIGGLCLHSWVKGGSLKAAKLYAKKIKIDEFVLLTTTFQNMTNFQSNPMRFELWKNGNPVESHSIFFAVEVINCILKSQTSKVDLFINHIMDFERNFENISLNLFNKIYFIINDYYIFNSKWNLFDDSETVMNRQLSIGGQKDFLDRLDELNISKLFKSINVFLSPSHDTFFRVKDLIPNKEIKVFYHLEEPNIEDIIVNKRNRDSETKNILILGDIGFYKGKREITLIIDYFRNSDEFKFHHFGTPINEINSNNYVNYGSYSANELTKTIENLNIDFAFLPFQCFETYSFVLSDIFNLGLPLISTNIGSITERCVKRSNTILLNCNPSLKEIVSAFDTIMKLDDSLVIKECIKFTLEDLTRSRMRNIDI